MWWTYNFTLGIAEDLEMTVNGRKHSKGNDNNFCPGAIFTGREGGGNAHNPLTRAVQTIIPKWLFNQFVT